MRSGLRTGTARASTPVSTGQRRAAFDRTRLRLTVATLGEEHVRLLTRTGHLDRQRALSLCRRLVAAVTDHLV